MRKISKPGLRLLSLLMAVIMLVGILPASALAADTVTAVVISGSDYQANTAQNTMTTIMNKIKSLHGNATGVLMGGDYSSGYTNKEDIVTVQSNITSVFPKIDTNNIIFAQGNHDNWGGQNPSNSLIATTGAHDTSDYGVYSINYTDFGSAHTGLQTYLNDKSGYSKPIFVVTHQPLHDTNRSDTGKENAANIVKVLNDAGAAGLNIIYMFGHNHSSTYDDYLGGAAIFLKKGDSMPIAGGSTEVLKFTYLNCGYVGYSSSKADDTLTMVAYEITNNSVTIKRYDNNGLYNLKSAGKSTGSFTVNSNVYGYAVLDLLTGESTIKELSDEDDNIGSGSTTPSEPDDGDDDVTTTTSVDITASSSGATANATIEVGQTLTINLKNGSSYNSKTFTATVEDDDIASVTPTSSFSIASGKTAEVKVKALAVGETSVVMTGSGSGDPYTATINLKVVAAGSGSTTPSEPGDGGSDLTPETVAITTTSNSLGDAAKGTATIAVGQDLVVTINSGSKNNERDYAITADKDGIVSVDKTSVHTDKQGSDEFTVTGVAAGKVVINITSNTVSPGTQYESTYYGEITVTVIPGADHEHSAVHVDAVDATCTAAGSVEYWFCAGCNTKFANEALTTEITNVETDMVAHIYGDTSYAWSDDFKTCTATHTCTVCKTNSESKTANSTSTVTTPATCESEGVRTYTATFDVDWAQEKTTTKAIEKAPHTPSTEWSKDESKHWHECSCGYKADEAAHVYTDVTYAGDGKTSYTATGTCTCGDTETATATITYDVTVEATCTAEGSATYTAKFDVDWAEQRVTGVAVPKAEHTYSSEWSTNETMHWHECECGAKADEAAHKSNVAASETAPELCATCGYEMNPVLGHAHAYGTVDYTGDGKTSYNASRSCTCGVTQNAIATITSVTTDATCTAEGSTVYTADFDVDWAEDKITTDVLAKLAHTYATTLTENGDQHYYMCTATGCIAISGLENHTYTDDLCACGAKKNAIDTGIAIAPPANGNNSDIIPAIVSATTEVEKSLTVTVYNDSNEARTYTITAEDQIIDITVNTASRAISKTLTVPAKSSGTFTVTAKAAGNVNITVQSDDNTTATIALTVAAAEVEEKTNFTKVNSVTKNGEYVIVIKSGDKYYTLDATTESASTTGGYQDVTYNGFKAVEIDVFGNDISGEIADYMIWNVSVSSNKLTIQNAKLGTYLAAEYSSSTTRKLLLNSGSNTAWSYTSDGYLQNDANKGDCYLYLADDTFSVRSTYSASAMEVYFYMKGAESTEQPETPVAGTGNIGFTSDVHDKVDNLEAWLKAVKHIGLDYMAFGGDFSYNSSNVSFNDSVDAVNNILGTGKGIYTTGNHDYDTGYIGSTSAYVTMQKTAGFTRIGVAAETDDYVIYNLGASQGDYNGAFIDSDITTLKNYLNTAPTDKAIFIVSHYPLHYIEKGNANSDVDREIGNANLVIETLNNSPLASNIIFLWGHNHSQTTEYNYGKIVPVGESIQYAGDTNASKQISFTYANMGAMNGSQEPYYGLIANVNENTVTLTYYNVDGSSQGSKTVTIIGADHEHSAVHVDAVDATCTATGTVEHWFCAGCNGKFADEALTTKITNVVVDTIAHVYGETSYAWSTDLKTCTATHTCTVCKTNSESKTANSTSTVTTPATCEGEGVRTYTATFNVDWAATQTQPKPEAVTGHNWSVSYSWNETYTECTATRSCANDATHNVTAKSAQVTSEQTKAPTCAVKGETTYTATFAAEWATAHNKTVANIDATGVHEFVNGMCSCGEVNGDAPLYLIVSDGYALTSQPGTSYSNNGSGNQKYNYYGFNGVKYSENMAITSDMLWYFVETEGGYYIMQGGKYLNATYVSNSTSGYDGTLKLDAVKDVWSFDSNGKLKSENSTKYLTLGNGSNSNSTLFSVRSESNAGVVTKILGTECKHVFSENWSKNFDEHWHECAACGEKTDVAAHEYVEGVCVCGAQKAQTPADSDEHNIGFTSDVHQTDNTNFKTWFNAMQNTLGLNLEYVAFGGDYATNGSSSLGVVNNLKTLLGNVPGIFTTGNHEWYGYTPDSANYTITGIGAQTDAYEIFCLGATGWYNGIGEFTEAEVKALEEYMKTAPTDIPIFVVSHFPLHYNSTRTIGNAIGVIEALNTHSNVIFLWGHNHSYGDKEYGLDGIIDVGGTIDYKSGSSAQINFTYASNGGMTNGANQNINGLVANVKGNTVTLTYYNTNGTSQGSKTITIAAGSAPETPDQPETPEQPAIAYGDCDGDGEVTATDAMLAMQYSVDLIDAKKLDVNAADVDGSGEIDATDAMLIMQYSIEYITVFPVELLNK